MRVLVACERSGVVRDAFRAAGHDAWSNDIEPSYACQNYHIIGDALEVAYTDPWDLMIAHPPCTYLTNAANRWLYEDSKDMTVEERLAEQKKAVAFFIALQHAPIEKIAIENPWPYVGVTKYIGKPDDLVQPWMFGDPESKGVCWWLKNLPPLLSTLVCSEREQKKWRLSENEDRPRLRAEFFPGMAAAMALQWGH